MGSNTNIRKRSIIFLGVSILMLVLGQTLLRDSLKKVDFVLYWTSCFVVTGLAILFAFLDVASVQRRAREEQRELLEKTVRDIARQKEIKSGRAKPD